MTEAETEERKEAIRKLSADRVLAHHVLFKHRHKDLTPDFHRDMILDTHSAEPRISTEAFRGGAKSTVVCEEATIIQALLCDFKNALIVGEKYERAVERLKAMRHEFETNETILGIFGHQQGETWTEGKLQLSNGVVLQAIGRNQSLRGSKHHDQRPDYLICDDIEDAESVRSEESKRDTLAWFLSVLMPALDKGARARVVGTPLETDSLMEALRKSEGWQSRRYPIEYMGENGERVATWPGRFPLEDIDKIRKTFERHGMLLEYGREYMMEARSGETRVFTADMFRTEPTARRWHPVYSFHDPARTVKESSAHTGKAVFSWIGSKLVVWEASGHFWRPDEIVNDMYETNRIYNPVVVGVEPDGLEEFLMQPLRHEGVKRGVILPVRAIRAPRGKDDFIRGLQPFFAAREVIFANPCPDLESQLLNFGGGGRKDVPNALAYALKMRPGLPVYEDFGGDHILDPERDHRKQIKYICAVNYQHGVLTGVLYQRTIHHVVITCDFVQEGDPQQRVINLIEWMNTETGGDVEIVVHPDHMERYATSGLVGALRKCGKSPRRGGDVTKGRGWIVTKLQTRKQERPALMVSQQAKWTINGFLGGYAFEMGKGGKGLSDRAPEGIYRTLLEGLESAAALAVSGSDDLGEKDGNYATDRHGNRYLSSMPGKG